MLCRLYLSKTGLCEGRFAQSRGLLRLLLFGQDVDAFLL